MIGRAAPAAGSLWIRSATAKPSISGICASSRTSVNGVAGRSRRSQRRRAPSRRSRPAPASSPSARSVLRGSRRLIALSSTTSTAMSRRSHRCATVRRLAPPASLTLERHGEVERAALARLALHPDAARPSARPAAARSSGPRPVPPNCRVVEPSAWLNGSKISLLLLRRRCRCRCPMTLNRRIACCRPCVSTRRPSPPPRRAR